MTDDTIRPAAYLQIEGLLAPEEHAQLLAMTLGNRDAFDGATITNPGGIGGELEEGFRRAKVFSDLDDVFPTFEERLQALLPHARREIGVAHFNLGHIERQLTAHDDGDFFGVHTDIGDSYTDAASRRLSYVYYFHASPKEFSGGALRLYDFKLDGEYWVAADSYVDIEPTDNSIVFFASDAYHEVRPVVAEGDGDGATRFTINGWFHDGDYVQDDPPLSPDDVNLLATTFLPNFSEHGFEKIKTPVHIHAALRALLDDRIDGAFTEGDDPYMKTGTPDFIDIADVKDDFLEPLRSMHEEWAGVDLEPSAAYGLRVYRDGHTLDMHVDWIPTHVVSSIVHLYHDVDEPWPLRIVDIHGNEHDVLLEEGETLLYESARCMHGRPTPMKGRGYSSMFFHYRPPDWDWNLSRLATMGVEEGVISDLS